MFLLPGSVLGDYPGSVPGALELDVLFGHSFQLLLQLNEVGCRRQHYWGPSRFFLSCCLCWIGHHDGRQRPWCLPGWGPRRFFVGICPAEADTAAFFEERAASMVECRLWLRTSLKPFPWLDYTAWLLAFRKYSIH
jgi:hypothetical protein